MDFFKCNVKHDTMNMQFYVSQIRKKKVDFYTIGGVRNFYNVEKSKFYYLSVRTLLIINE